jgi:indole-3-glycerol phosphate synthase
MNETFLEKILESTRQKVEAAKAAVATTTLQNSAESVRSGRPPNLLRAALAQKGRKNVIAEIKRASPSKGVINDQVNVAMQAKNYEEGGACAISVLTEEQYFRGSIDDLRAVRKVVSLPILRKDFTVDEYQIYEAAAAGADAILLIVAALTPTDLITFKEAANALGMDAIVEVHTLEELVVASQIRADIIGVNNRDLKTFDVTLDVSRKLIRERPPGSLMLAESGISSREQIMELSTMGFDGFLIGESLMRGGTLAALRK